MLYHNTIKTLFTSFARCLQQLAFSGCEEAIENDETSVSQLVGSPSGYKNKSSHHQGPVCREFVTLQYWTILFFAHYMTFVNLLSDMGAMSLNFIK